MTEDQIEEVQAIAKAATRYAAALRQIASGKYDGMEVTHYTARECRDLARQALSGSKP